MSHPRCKKCELLFCDIISRECRLTPREVVVYRKDMLTNAIRNKRHSDRMNGAKRHKRRVKLRNEFVPDNSMAVRYDKRRKRDTPRRQWEREYRQNKAQRQTACVSAKALVGASSQRQRTLCK